MVPLATAERERAGFTLIELIVVLAILAAILAIAIPNAMRGSGRLQLAATAQEIAAALRMTRSRAIAQNQPTRFIADLGAGAFAADKAERLQKIPKGIALSLLTTTDQAYSSTIGSIRFYPDGSSSGGGIALSGGGRRYEVLVNWLTGNVSIHPDNTDRWGR